MNTEKNALRSTGTSMRTAATVAGVGLLLMTILAPIVEFSVFQELVVPGDVQTTAVNLATSVGTLRTSTVIFVIVAVLDVIVAWALYVLLTPVDKSLSLLSAWLRVVYGAILAIALNSLFSTVRLFTEATYSILAADQLNAQAMLFLSAFRDGWDLALVFFGPHLIILGYLVFRSDYIPKWLGVLLVIAGLGYLVDSFGKFLLPDYDLGIAMFTFIGEPLLMFYLLWKGIKGFGNGAVKAGGEN
jgi:hypothetical protein